MKKSLSRSATKRAGLVGREFLLSDRDSDILEFLWKWKLASTATIHEAIGRPNTAYSTYKALERLEKSEFIESITNQKHRFTVWQLAEPGFDAIREDLGELKEEGFLSEYPWHDRNVVAFQLGEWATYRFPMVAHFTEQELRRRPPDYYPEWAPKIGDHRSDGYTRITTDKKSWVLSYEVELSAKSRVIYESVIRFYRAYRSLDRVLWLVGTPYVLSQILAAKTAMRDPQDNYHLFVDLAQYQRQGWDAPVTNCKSETLFTIREHMRGMAGEICGELMGNMQGQSTVTVHYDPYKVLGKSGP